jgi:hypothetical protein
MPGENGLCAYIDGPVVLAGLNEREVSLSGEFRSIDVRHWSTWRNDYIRDGIYFKPLYEIIDEKYTVYFKQP